MLPAFSHATSASLILHRPERSFSHRTGKEFTEKEHRMARRRHALPAAEPRATSIENVIKSLGRMPRLSSHQKLALHLAGLALDLPDIHDYPPRSPTPTRVRSSDRFPESALVLWCLKVFDEHPLAGVVLTDAMEYVSRALAAFTGEYFELFPSAQAKRWLTERMERFYVEFEAPTGWEIVIEGEARPAGFSGLAQVVRCHLSQTPYPGERGYGRWTTGTMQDQDAIGFDIPAVYFPDARIEDERLVFNSRQRHHEEITVRVPYCFVKRAFPRPVDATEAIRPYARPTNEEIQNTARCAVERLWAEHSDRAR
jgi:hypothetical protein